MISTIKEDLKAYRKSNGKIQWDEPSIICVILYRIGHRIQKIKFAPIRILFNIIHLPFFFLFNTIIGIYIPRGAQIGGGLRIHHYGCIIINPDTIMGENCILRQGVTIGTKNKDHDVPVIGNNVEFGAGAKVLGKIKIGNNVTIGANAVVLCDVPDNSIAVGIPAKIYPKKS